MDEGQGVKDGRLARFESELTALVELMVKAPATEEALYGSLWAVTEIAARVLRASRVSVWLLDAQATVLCSVDTFDSATAEHSLGLTLNLADCPRLWRALGEGLVVKSCQAAADPLATEFLAGCAEPHLVGALLTMPLRLQGKVAGMLTLEHHGEEREWGQDEVLFAQALAAHIGSAMTLHEAGSTREDFEALRQELDRAWEAARSAGAQARTEAIRWLGGQIRQPLEASLRAVDRLLGGPLDDVWRGLIDAWSQPTRHALRLLDQAVELAQLDGGDSPAVSEEFSPRDTVAGLLQDASSRVESRWVRLTSEVEVDVPLRLRGDAPKLRRILGHLLENAIQFTAQGSITLRVAPELPDESGQALARDVAEDAVFLRLSVSDTGAGIASELIPGIFCVPIQSPLAAAPVRERSGLGLALTARLVSLMGGEIWVESCVGAGSTFHCRLPFRCWDAGPARPQPASLEARSGGSPGVGRPADAAAVDAGLGARDTASEPQSSAAPASAPKAAPDDQEPGQVSSEEGVRQEPLPTGFFEAWPRIHWRLERLLHRRDAVYIVLELRCLETALGSAETAEALAAAQMLEVEAHRANWAAAQRSFVRLTGELNRLRSG
jgi:signal transduction histidine kinase